MLLDKVKNTIKRYGLINKGDKIIVGVSGGPDSVTLLYLLNSLRREFKIGLHIAYLDHMLRKDSDKDGQFVEALALKLKIPVSTAKVDVKALSKKGSTEEVARNARLDFLFKVAKEAKADKIALGHNLDDQAETVLMRILRGTGMYGLSGILPKRSISGFTVIRPLVETTRLEIEAYLRQKKIKPRQDITNSQDLYFRNKIRNKLLPLLEKGYSSNIKELLSNMAGSLGCDYDYLNSVAQKYFRNMNPKIDLEKFLKLHPAIQRLVLRMNIASLKGDTRRLTFQHIKEIEDLLYHRPVYSVVDLPKGVSVVKKPKYIQFLRKNR